MRDALFRPPVSEGYFLVSRFRWAAADLQTFEELIALQERRGAMLTFGAKVEARADPGLFLASRF
jgi:hypothetical protein